MNLNPAFLAVLSSLLSLAFSKPLNLDLSVQIPDEVSPNTQVKFLGGHGSAAGTTDDGGSFLPTSTPGIAGTEVSNVLPTADKPKYSDTAKVLFFNDFDFTGDKKRYQVLNQKCYDLPEALENYVLSAKLNSKIWYCTFFPEKKCEVRKTDEEEVHRLSAGDYDNLFPDGMDFVSFKCAVYEGRPDTPPLVRLSKIHSQHNEHTHWLSAANPLSVRVFSEPDFSGNAKVFTTTHKEPTPCLILDELTDLRSVSLGTDVLYCVLFPSSSCQGAPGQVLSQSMKSVHNINVKSMNCIARIGEERHEPLQSIPVLNPSTAKVPSELDYNGQRKFWTFSKEGRPPCFLTRGTECVSLHRYR